MQKRSTLRLSILALAIVPVVLEIILLVALSNLHSQADMELERSVRAQKITEGINSISKQMYDAFFMFSAEKHDEMLTKEAMEPIIVKFRKTYDDLEKLTAGDEHSHSMIASSSKAANRAVELMEILRGSLDRDGKTEAARAFRKPYWYELRKQTKTILTPEFLNLRREEAQVAEAAPLIQKDIREKIQFSIWTISILWQHSSHS